MDIAEIRKKAKETSSSEPPVAEPALTDTPVAEQGAAESINEVSAEEPAAGFVLPEASDVGLVSEGLDQLFAATEELSLATDESYADLLENQAETASLASNQYLAFYLGAEEYALDIKQISEIIKVREFTDIPRAPKFILGIISLRGVVVPVYDLRQRLNLGESELSPTSRIVVCQLEDVAVGFLVDSINQVVKLADAELEPPPGVLSGLDRDMVTGIGRYQGRMIILLNLQSVLDVEI